MTAVASLFYSLGLPNPLCLDDSGYLRKHVQCRKLLASVGLEYATVSFVIKVGDRVGVAASNLGQTCMVGVLVVDVL